MYLLKDICFGKLVRAARKWSISSFAGSDNRAASCEFGYREDE